MIDLTKKILPSAVSVDGRFFRIKTDFRYWLRFSELLKTEKPLLVDFDFLYGDDIPDDRQAGVDALCEFFANVNPLPRDTGGGSEARAFDYEIDGELIYAAFRQQYGIDLFKINLHWHCFKALFSGLRETKFTDVIGYRLYEESKKEYETIQRDLRHAWELEHEMTEETREAFDDFNAQFK